MSYPTLVYRCPGPHFAHAGQTYDYAKVRDEDELSQRLEAGWHLSLVEAVDAATGKVKVKAAEQEPGEPGDDEPATREELETMANDLGIKYDGRTSDAGLLRKIEEALAERS